MGVLQHTLISDGPTDANLIPIINWTLREAGGVPLAEGVRAEFWRLPKPPKTLADRIIKAVEMFPCRILFIHRDAEKEPASNRHKEIQHAVQEASERGCILPAVAVVPVRMLEAWLLFDEPALRRAAGNPNGASLLQLPSMTRVESRPDPKNDLQAALRTASGLSGRRLKKFNTGQALWRVVDFVSDFTPLRQLPAFRRFEESVRQLCVRQWQSGFYGAVEGKSDSVG